MYEEMRSVSLTALRKDFENWVEIATVEPVLITRYGKPYLVMVPFEQFKSLESLTQIYEKVAGKAIDQD